MKRSKFSLSHYKLLTCDMGELIPCGLMEVLPGDTIQHKTSLLVRVSPLIAPIMHPISVRIHHWFVPFRLLWDQWEEFITGGADNNSQASLPHFTVGATGAPIGSLADYLGLPEGMPQGNILNAMPFRAYNLIWNEWYRDQDLSPPLIVSKGGGPDTTTSRTLAHIAWEKDYFTSARPWAQKGPEVTIPIGTEAPVKGLGVATTATTSNTDRTYTDSDGEVWPSGTPVFSANAATTLAARRAGGAGTGGMPDIYADLTDATAVSINELREAFALQRFAEARARYGSRYVEYLRYLGVRSSDHRLQRPEYLGGGRQTLQISEVLQTAPGTPPDSVVGQLKGHGIGAMRSNRYRRFFEEHGYVVSLLSVRPKTIYSQGYPKLWSRWSRESFWQKELEHVGQQEVLNHEVYALLDTGGVFGYQDRYDEYRRMESTVSGEFRSSQMNHWHMARDFAAVPVLNNSFVTCTPTKRVNAVATNDVLWIMANHSIQARRMLARSGTSHIY